VVLEVLDDEEGRVAGIIDTGLILSTGEISITPE